MAKNIVAADVATSYRKIAKAYKAKVKSEELDHTYIERFLLTLQPKDRVLDIGAGTGALAEEMILNHQLKVTAIDLSAEMVKLAHKNYPDVRMLQMDMLKMNFPKASYDAVFANYSLIHVADQDISKAISKISYVLKKNGYLYLSLQEPRGKRDKDGYYPVVYRPSVKMFLKLFTKRDISKYLSKAGFKIVYQASRKADPKMEFKFNKLFIIAQKTK